MTYTRCIEYDSGCVSTLVIIRDTCRDTCCAAFILLWLLARKFECFVCGYRIVHSSVIMSTAFETIMREKLKDFNIVDGQFMGHCDTKEEIEDLLMQLKFIGFSYSVRSSHCARRSPRFFFTCKLGNVKIPFFGSVFSIESTVQRECVLGPKYREKKEAHVPDHLVDHVNPKRKRECIMDTRKSGCSATFAVKCIRIYPAYSIEAESDHNEIKNKVIKRLKDDLASADEPKSILRFHVVASPPSSHTHSADCVKVTGDLHPSLASEIMRVVSGGTTSVKVIRLHLENFVNSNFNVQTMPDHNIMFYPTDKIIRNHIYESVHKIRKTKIDQDALHNQVNEWKRESSGDKIYFRSYSKIDGEVTPLLFCYQTKWQVELLKKYGGVCLLDATYKTTKYDIPLFFITVKANVCYLVVGFFFVQVENSRSISEALMIFKDWNIGMNPSYWVTDFSESEIKAIEQVFPSSKVNLCSFHRAQAWNRWLSKSGNLTVSDHKIPLLHLWEHIAASPSVEHFNHNMEKLRSNPIFTQNTNAVRYFENQWIPVAQRWVKAFGDNDIFSSVNTTNGAEAMNKCAKYAHLKQSSDKTLTGVVLVLVNSFVPSLIKKYCQLNSAVKSYSEKIPLFLQGKTPEFVKHVMIRLESVKSEYRAEWISVRDEGLFRVRSAETKDCYYIVNFTVPDCTCPDFKKFKYPCKHFCAIFHFFPEWGFEKLNTRYTTSVLICLDESYGFGTRGIQLTRTETGNQEIINICEETNDQGNIPNTSSSMRHQTRERLKQLINITYSCSDETLRTILDDITILQNNVDLLEPTENGLPIIMASSSKR